MRLEVSLRLLSTNVTYAGPRRIVGIGGDQAEPSDAIAGTVYVPYAQGTGDVPPGLWLVPLSLVVSPSAGAASALAAVRQAVWSVSPNLPLYDVAEMAAVIEVHVS